MRVYAGGVEERKITDMAPAEMTMPTTTTKVEAAGRLPSIEMEPKTLTLDQIKYARDLTFARARPSYTPAHQEAALYVVSTKSEEEAIRIFTAGLKPVQTSMVARKSSSFDSSDDDVDLDGSFDGSNTGGRCGSKGRRGRRSSSMEIRDIATAPF
ncbi:hypothetical protein EJB05_02674 [Eragrostis curvula]|uniref:Uncharacterized protein n=1 Tax=Eragrostis curvula TaxID=38414 RepID=A0A5J9WT20_9POAL|nr:hypothetical protein EJB05_02674 [Eragrostis curvula]